MNGRHLIDMINLWHKFIDWKRDYFDSPYCKECKSCGEEGCCSIEKSLLGHDCKYGEYYAKEVCFNKVLVNELLKSISTIEKMGPSTAKEVIDAAYDKAFKFVEEKYKK